MKIRGKLGIMHSYLTIIRIRYLILFLSIILTLPVNPVLYAQDGDTSRYIGPGKFIIDPDRSILKIFVGRAGLLSEMGHNHIVISKDITGELDYKSAPGSSSAKFKIPVHTLIVDDEIERRYAGNGYESVPSESDIQGTRENMLGNRVLDSEEYPEINVHVNGVVYINTLNQYHVELSFKDHQLMLNLDGQTQLAGDNIIIDAYFILDHAQLNLRPFSVLGGMMKVAEQLRFELHLEASPESQLRSL